MFTMRCTRRCGVSVIAMAALFDMANLSRANDAGGIMALGILKLPAGDRLPADGPDKNEATELVATSLPDAPKRLPEAYPTPK